MLDKNNQVEIRECTEKIYRWFLYDTFTLLDCVLTDDQINPQYSANVTYNRLEQIVIFQSLYYGTGIHSVSDFLSENGYTDEDISLFNQKRIEEDLRYEQ